MPFVSPRPRLVLLALLWVLFFYLVSIYSSREVIGHVQSGESPSLGPSRELEALPTRCPQTPPHPKVKAIVVISVPPTATAEDVLISTRSVVLSGEDQVIERLIVADALRSLSMQSSEWEMVANAAPFPVELRTTTSEGEALVRASVEPYLLELTETKPRVLVFLDSTCMVESGWLAPLVAEVSQDPLVVAVPMVTDYSSKRAAVRSGGSLQWSLETAPLSLQDWKDSRAEVEELRRRLPALTGAAFAVHSDWWRTLDGYSLSTNLGIGVKEWSSSAASSLPGASALHSELSLRIWNCGGAVHLVPCSSVTQHVPIDAPSRSQAVQTAAIISALTTAELWLSAHAEQVWLALGVPRVAETFDRFRLSLKESKLEEARTLLGVSKKCQPFDWYLQNVDASLLQSVQTKASGGISKVAVAQPAAALPPPSEASAPRTAQAPAREAAAAPQMRRPVPGPSAGFSARLEAASVPAVPDQVDPKLLVSLAQDPHQNFPPLPAKQECQRRDGHSELLHQVALASPEEYETPVRSRIFCMVYTIQKQHQTSIRAVRETWASKCDGFVTMSDLTDPSIPTLNVPHEGPEEYNNIWQKVRSIWLYVYTHYFDDYDYFYIGGDDLYVIVENLRLYLNSKEIVEASDHGTRPLFLGRRFAQNGNKDRIFNSGGSGYILNQASLRILAENSADNAACNPHIKGFYEDVLVAACLRKVAQVFPYDTRDAHGRERFHPFTPAAHLSYRISPKNPDWYAKYSSDLKQGKECCSSHSIAFHYVKPQLMRRLHALLYACDG